MRKHCSRHKQRIEVITKLDEENPGEFTNVTTGYASDNNIDPNKIWEEKDFYQNNFYELFVSKIYLFLKFRNFII